MKGTIRSSCTSQWMFAHNPLLIIRQASASTCSCSSQSTPQASSVHASHSRRRQGGCDQGLPKSDGEEHDSGNGGCLFICFLLKWTELLIFCTLLPCFWVCLLFFFLCFTFSSLFLFLFSLFFSLSLSGIYCALSFLVLIFSLISSDQYVWIPDHSSLSGLFLHFLLLTVRGRSLLLFKEVLYIHEVFNCFLFYRKYLILAIVTRSTWQPWLDYAKSWKPWLKSMGFGFHTCRFS